MRRITYTIEPQYAGVPVGDVMRRALHMSRRGVIHAKYTDQGILLDGERTRTNMPVCAGQTLDVLVGDTLADVAECSVEPQEGPVDVLYADDDLLVVNKPAGLVMYPSPGHDEPSLGSYVMAYLAAQGRTCALHPVHRLDRGTSGAVVFSTNAHAQQLLTNALHTDGFVRRYVALCEGLVEPTHGTIEAPIACISQSPNVYGVSPDGKPAVTEYQRLEAVHAAGEKRSLLMLQLHTGRTHQIRIHMAHVGHPLVGDAAYGGNTELFDRPLLHSAFLALNHPLTGQHIHLNAPLPDDAAALLGELGFTVPEAYQKHTR